MSKGFLGSVKDVWRFAAELAQKRYDSEKDEARFQTALNIISQRTGRAKEEIEKSLLGEQMVIRTLREEYERKLSLLAEEITPVLHHDVDGDDEPETMISAGLKIAHKKSKIRYTVHSVGPSDVILITPEGTQFIVDTHELEEEYELV